jgi:hypothetical protein
VAAKKVGGVPLLARLKIGVLVLLFAGLIATTAKFF